MSNKKYQAIAAELRPALTKLVRKLRKISPVGGLLSQSERSVLILLEQSDSLLSTELAMIEKMTPQSMGQLLKHLSSLELIQKEVSETDKRKINISLSPKGKKVIQTVRNEKDEWLGNAMEAACSSEDIAILKAAIIPLSKIVEFE